MKTVSVLLATAALLLFAGLAFAAPAELEIISPKEGGTISPTPGLGSVVLVEFRVKNFKLVDYNENTAVNDNEGHLHVQLDNNPYTTHTSKARFVFGGLAPGTHTVTLELHRNDHSPLTKPVKKTVTFTVR